MQLGTITAHFYLLATVKFPFVPFITLFPSYTSSLHCCKSGHSAPFLQQWGHSQLALFTACSNFILIYSNLFEFLLNLFEFCRGFWVKRVCVGMLRYMIYQQHHPMFLLAYIYYKVFIQASGLACEVYIAVSLLHSLPTMVCEVADSVVCQVAMLPFFNSLWG